MADPVPATPVIGAMGPYQPEAEKIESYLERLELYLAANSIPEGRRVPAILTIVGATTYELLRSLVAPALPQTKTYAQLVETLKKHYSPTPVVIAERFHFHRRSQHPGESIAEYMAELRRLSVHCEFGDYLNQALRDRLVCGLRSETIQKRLLSEVDLDLTRALSLAQGQEAADRNVKSLKGAEGDIKNVPKSASPPRSAPPRHAAAAPKKPCYRCGRGNHTPSECRFREAECHNCGKKGHIAPVCRGSKQANAAPHPRRNRPSKPKPASTKWMAEEPASATSPDGDEEDLPIFAMTSPSTPMHVELLLNNKVVSMEIDTGAAVSLISEEKLHDLFPETVPRETNVTLKTYTGERIDMVGEVDMAVQYGDQKKDLVLVVVAGSGPVLLGRNWLQEIRLDWKKIGSLAVNHNSFNTLESVLKRYSAVFKDELGGIHPQKAKLIVKPEATPKFHRPRPVPFALKGAIEEELSTMEAKGIIEKVTHSDWAAPIVPVPKRDGKIRICGDYTVTVNQALAVDQHPLPKPDDLFAALAGGQKFTKLDLSQAYFQLSLDEESKEFVTINTHKGLFRFNRLPFGVSSAPAQFQKVMDEILQGIPKCMCYIDDICITGANTAEHLRILAQVLQRLEEHGVRIKRSKCQFLADSIDYLGHKIDATGLHAISEKLDAITQAPVPTNVTELRSFLGLLNYYRKFLPNLATLLQPLNELLQVHRKWKWSAECTTAFQKAKKLLTTSRVLVHYDPVLPIRMAADASAYGIGAVISHRLSNGEEKPIAFASRTLSSSERNYAQIEKEALALVFGVRKFHQYLYGRKFTMITDHRPLTTILGPKKGIPPIAAARMQRWAVQLAAYSYDIEFKSTKDHGNADALSRLPLKIQGPEGMSTPSVYNTQQIASLPTSSTEVEQATRRDPVLARVLQYTRKGWPDQVSEEVTVFKNRKHELGTEGDCLLWGARVVIPTKLRDRMLKDLHRDHPGVVRMKAIARSYMWWPGLDKALEKVARSCVACQAVKQTPANAPLHPWTWPDRPWQRVHIDFAGPFQGKMFFLAIDAHSKWGEIFEMTQTTTTKTIALLRQLIATYGLPEQIVSDNGPQFISEEFREFTRGNGIRHIRCAPYHPASNGLVERFVRTFKEAMKASKNDGLPLSHRLQNFLFTYRTTPHATTKKAPCALFLGRQLRTRLDLLRPNLQDTVLEKQSIQKSQHDQHAKEREMEVGQTVMVRNLRPGEAWIPGVVVRKLGPVSYLVDVGEGKVWKRHVDHLKVRELPTPENSTSEGTSDLAQFPSPEVTTGTPVVPEVTLPDGRDELSPSTPVANPVGTNTNPPETEPEHTNSPSNHSQTREPYPTRIRRKPDRYHDEYH